MDAYLFPRLDRRIALELLAGLRDEPAHELSGRMPLDGLPTQFSPVGGIRATDDELAALRDSVVAVAIAHGFPDRQGSALGTFDTACARTLHQAMAITPYEAGHEEIWTHLTLCWLLDVAAWRYPSLNDERVIGTADRNTFRRLWWRAQVLHEPGTPWNGLYGLGEDELVQIMERPTLWGQPALARAIAHRFSREVATDSTLPRMELMRDVTRRMIRLTPFVMTDALTPNQLARLVDGALRQSMLALTGRDSTLPAESTIDARMNGVSDAVELLGTSRDGAVRSSTVPAAGERQQTSSDEDGEPERIAVALAVQLGRVTNATLREATGLDRVGARRVLLALVARDVLEQRGAKRGTYYVMRTVSTEVETLADYEEAASTSATRPAPALRQPLLRSLRKAVGRQRPRP